MIQDVDDYFMFQTREMYNNWRGFRHAQPSKQYFVIEQN